MNTEETTPGTKFKYQGCLFTLGINSPDCDTLYVKDPNDEIYETSLSEFKRKVRDGVYELIETENNEETKPEMLPLRLPKNPPVMTSNGVDKVKVNGVWTPIQSCEMVAGEWRYKAGLGVPQGSPQDRSEAQPECGPADRQPPEDQSITPELLEKEGWESLLPLVASRKLFYKCPVYAHYRDGEFEEVTAGNLSFPGIKSMPDLRTLVRLVNGVPNLCYKDDHPCNCTGLCRENC